MSRRRALLAALAVCAAVPVTVGSASAGSGFVPVAVSASVQEVFADPALVYPVLDISCATTTACVVASTPPERTLDGGATWQPFRVPSTSGRLNAVRCFSTGVCLVADGYLLARSTDFGVSWVPSTTPSFDYVHSFDCAAPTSCVAVGWDALGHATVATSADGGSTWTERTSSLGARLGRVVCPNPTLCVALGDDGVMKSTNAGVSWTTVAAAPTPSWFDSLECVAPSTCMYSAGSAIEVTTDGSTWVPMPLPFNEGPFYAITCASATLCVASSQANLDLQHFDPTARTFTLEPANIGLGLTDAMDCVGLTCYEVETSLAFPTGSRTFANRSDNGATFWSSVHFLSGGSSIADFDCPDATHCIAVGLDAAAQSPFTIQSAVLLSADGGATWQPEPPPGNLPNGLFSVACVPSTTVCITVGNADLATGQAGIDRSADGGLTWQPVTTDVPLRSFGSVKCMSASMCLALGSDMSASPAGDRSVVMRSTDGGLSWQSSMSVPLQAQFLDCQTASTCMLLRYQTSPGPIALMRTADGGTTWTFANPPVADVQSVRSIECNSSLCAGTFDSSIGIVGRVTTDAGLTWTTPSLQSQPSMFAPLPRCTPAICVYVPSFVDPSEIRTWTGTGGWDLVASPPATYVHHLICPQPTVCLALATSGVTFGTAIERIVLNATPVGTVSGVQPARLLETRVGPGFETVDHLFEGTGALGAGSTLVLQVAGRGGVAANATSAMLNVTVTQASKPGFVTVYPCDQGQPVASNVNFVKGSTVANGVLAKLAANGTVCVFTQQTTHMVIDVGAFVPNDSASIIGVSPARLMETRKGPGLVTVDHLDEGAGVLPGGGVTAVQIAGRGGVPAGAKAAVLNVTATQAQAPGFLTVYPCDKPRPVASNVNYVAGATVPNTVYATLDVSGYICIYSLATTHLIVDVDAYAPGSGSYLQPLVPARLLETRPGLPTVDGLFGGSGRLEVRTPFVLQVAGRGGVPVGASTAMLNVTVTESTDGGFVTVYPCDQPVPLASNVNFDAGATVANAVVAKLAANGTVCVYSSAPTQVLVDANAYIP